MEPINLDNIQATVRPALRTVRDEPLAEMETAITETQVQLSEREMIYFGRESPRPGEGSSGVQLIVFLHESRMPKEMRLDSAVGTIGEDVPAEREHPYRMRELSVGSSLVSVLETVICEEYHLDPPIEFLFTGTTAQGPNVGANDETLLYAFEATVMPDIEPCL